MRADCLGLQVRQLELFPQPVDDLVDLELEHELQIRRCRCRPVAALRVALLGCPGRSTSPGSPRPGRRRSRSRDRAGGSARARARRTGTSTVRSAGPRDQVRRRRSGRAGCPRPTRALSRCGAASRARRARTGRTSRLGGDAQRRLPARWRSELIGVSESVRRAAADMRVLFLREQRGDVVQRFAGAVGVVAVLVDQPLLDHRDLLLRVSRRGACVELTRRSTSRRCSNRYCSIASCSSAWLSSVNLSPRLNAPIALRTTSWRNDCLPDSEMSIFSSTERRKRSSGLRSSPVIGSLISAVVERRLDLVEVLVEQLLRLLLERDEQRLVHVLLHPAVVEILARDDQEIDPLALLLRRRCARRTRSRP